MAVLQILPTQQHKKDRFPQGIQDIKANVDVYKLLKDFCIFTLSKMPEMFRRIPPLPRLYTVNGIKVIDVFYTDLTAMSVDAKQVATRVLTSTSTYLLDNQSILHI